MINLKDILEKYNENVMEYFQEIGVIKGTLSLFEWDLLNDKEKLQIRKNKLDYFEKHFNIDEQSKIEREYESLIVILSELIIEFFKKDFVQYSNGYIELKRCCIAN